jgi:hypothetical protein
VCKNSKWAPPNPRPRVCNGRTDRPHNCCCLMWPDLEGGHDTTEEAGSKSQTAARRAQRSTRAGNDGHKGRGRARALSRPLPIGLGFWFWVGHLSIRSSATLQTPNGQTARAERGQTGRESRKGTTRRVSLSRGSLACGGAGRGAGGSRPGTSAPHMGLLGRQQTR